MTSSPPTYEIFHFTHVISQYNYPTTEAIFCLAQNLELRLSIGYKYIKFLCSKHYQILLWNAVWVFFLSTHKTQIVFKSLRCKVILRRFYWEIHCLCSLFILHTLLKISILLMSYNYESLELSKHLFLFRG